MRLDKSITAFSSAGDLIIDLRPHIDSCLKYGSWASGLAVSGWEGGSWVTERSDPGIPLLNPANDRIIDAPVHRFTAGIPVEVRQCAAAFNYLQTTLLQMAARSAAAADLLRQNPLLLWLLADTVRTQHWTATETDRVLRTQHRNILERLTGVRSKSALQILHKIQLLKGSKHELALIRKIIRAERLRRPLVHLPSLSVCGLAALERYPQFSGSQVLQNVFRQNFSRPADALETIAKIKPVWDDARLVAEVLGIGDADLALKRCSTLTDIQRLHDRWTQRLNRRSHLLDNGRKTFPPPPLPGNTDIHPIQSEEDLYLEGRLLHHCVGTYANKIHSGTSYLYRTLQPERGTLELRLHGSACEIGQFKLAHNGEPSQDSWMAVQAWLGPAASEAEYIRSPASRLTALQRIAMSIRRVPPKLRIIG